MFAFQTRQYLLFKQANILCFWRTTQTQFTKRIEWLQPNSKNMKHEASGTLCPKKLFLMFRIPQE